MTETGLLTLTQWLSPGFPVGAFAYSHGLETAIAAGEVADAAGLAAWLDDILTYGAGRSDAVLLAAAHRGDDPAALTDLAAALAASAERWEETRDQGRAFAATRAGIEGAAADPWPYPIALGVAARGLGLPTVRVAALYLHAFAGNLVTIATRAVPLGQTEGQRVLSDLRPRLLALAQAATETDPDTIATAVPRGDLLAMRHETLDVRLFKT